MEPDDLLCSRNARSGTPLARANGASRRASGWAGEKVARSGRSIRPYPWERTSELEREGARQLAWSLCSQSPHGEAVVARCAQKRPHQPPR